MSSEPKQLEWSAPQKPNETIRYDHVIAHTPFGRFLITWKGWKENDTPSIDETPWGEPWGVGSDLEDAKAIAEAEFKKRHIHSQI